MQFDSCFENNYNVFKYCFNEIKRNITKISIISIKILMFHCVFSNFPQQTSIILKLEKKKK